MTFMFFRIISDIVGDIFNYVIFMVQPRTILNSVSGLTGLNANFNTSDYGAQGHIAEPYSCLQADLEIILGFLVSQDLTKIFSVKAR